MWTETCEKLRFLFYTSATPEQQQIQTFIIWSCSRLLSLSIVAAQMVKFWITNETQRKKNKMKSSSKHTDGTKVQYQIAPQIDDVLVHYFQMDVGHHAEINPGFNY